MIKKYIMAAMLTMALAPALAAEDNDCISVGDVKIGEDGTGVVTVNLDTNVTDYNCFEMNLYLPEGFTVLKNRFNEYDFTFNTADDGMVYNHTMNVGEHDGFLRFVGASLSGTCIIPGNTWLFKFTIKAPEWFDTAAEGSFRKVGFAAGKTVETGKMHRMPDVSFAIEPYEDDSNTGIDDVTADGNAPVEYYNLQGIRVDNPANGIYIKKQGNQATRVYVK